MDNRCFIDKNRLINMIEKNISIENVKTFKDSLSKNLDVTNKDEIKALSTKTDDIIEDLYFENITLDDAINHINDNDPYVRVSYDIKTKKLSELYNMKVYINNFEKLSYSSLNNIKDELMRIINDLDISDNPIIKFGMDVDKKYNPREILTIGDDKANMFSDSEKLKFYSDIINYRDLVNPILLNNEALAVDSITKFIEFLDQVSMRTIHY